ncbi:MAG: amidohydrolase family protein [Candidatus Sungbacteria bacterium]|nr:amidohydrolase family protein [Candidatus Sungbacteria bacterium]
MTYDILIKDGTIISGAGQPRFRADIGISGGSIKDIGNPTLPGADGQKTITAFGKFVTPGFVDITSHADKNWSLFQNPLQDYLLTQGVTTILIGNCGSSLAPLVAAEAADLLQKWSEVEISNINWSTVGELARELERHPLGVNVATLIGHGTIRRGLTQGEPRPLAIEEIQQAVELVEKGMKDGAFGLSTGLAYSHEAIAKEVEISSLAKAAARYGGIYKTHLRSESLDIIPAVSEAIRIGRESGAGVIISHLKAIGRKSWPFFRKALGMIERASRDGLKLNFDISPYQRTGSLAYLLLPNWSREGGPEAILKRLASGETRAAVVEAVKNQTLHYERYIVANSTSPSANGRTIAEIAGRRGQAPEETLAEIILASQGRAKIFGKTISLKNIADGIAHSLSVVASDGSGVSVEVSGAGVLVHPRSTGAFPHFLHSFVGEKKLMSWEEGIRKITSLPAAAVGFEKRGRIEKKFHADIVVFDPEKIHDRATYHNPYVHSRGIEAVVVNGKLAIENGQLTGIAAGQVLKKR